MNKSTSRISIPKSSRSKSESARSGVFFAGSRVASVATCASTRETTSSKALYTGSADGASAELARWLARRSTQSRASIEAVERRTHEAAKGRAAAFKRRPRVYRTSDWTRRETSDFGELCEASEGLAVEWRRKGCTEREMWRFVYDNPFVLCELVPLLHRLGFTEDEVIEYVPRPGFFAELLLFFAEGPYGRRGTLGVTVAWTLATLLRRMATKRVARVQGRLTRPERYAAERKKRRAMATERRRVARRTTTSPCPKPDELLEAWRHARDTKESLIRFGSMLQDLECYLDNALRFCPDGRIKGRGPGIKGWLREHASEMAEHYSSVMRYKAAAKKLRQLVGLADPTPVAEVLEENNAKTDTTEEKQGDEVSCDYGAAKKYIWQDVRQARVMYRKIMKDVPDIAAQVLSRIDALCNADAVG